MALPKDNWASIDMPFFPFDKIDVMHGEKLLTIQLVAFRAYSVVKNGKQLYGLYYVDSLRNTYTAKGLAAAWVKTHEPEALPDDTPEKQITDLIF